MLELTILLWAQISARLVQRGRRLLKALSRKINVLPRAKRARGLQPAVHRVPCVNLVFTTRTLDLLALKVARGAPLGLTPISLECDLV